MSYSVAYSFTPSSIDMPSAQYHYTPAPAPAPTRSTKTEFRGSTNPDEDWTKISDLAERRRIQNRIAQRNYRKKLKRRLEDLERRAASRSLSPNGDDTDGRSTRESTAEAGMSPPPSSDPAAIDSYTIPPYTPAYGRAATYSPPASHNYYSSPTEPTTTADYSAAPHYLYSYSTAPAMSSLVDTACGSPVGSLGSDHGSYLPLPSQRLSSANSYTVSTPPDYSPKTSPIIYSADHMSPFGASYASLTEPPADPAFFSSQYYDHTSSAAAGHSPVHIKSESYGN